jgi:hypothetical protein
MPLVRLDLTRGPAHETYLEFNGEAEFAVNPEHPLNRVIVDLELAPRDASGRVHFSTDVLRPLHPPPGKRGLFLDVVNRGRARRVRPGARSGFNDSIRCRGRCQTLCQSRRVPRARPPGRRGARRAALSPAERCRSAGRGLGGALGPRCLPHRPASRSMQD